MRFSSIPVVLSKKSMLIIFKFNNVVYVDMYVQYCKYIYTHAIHIYVYVFIYIYAEAKIHLNRNNKKIVNFIVFYRLARNQNSKNISIK